MLLADDAWIENARSRRKRIDRRIDSDFRQCTRKHSSRVEVSERGGRSGIGQIIGRDVNGLHRGDGTFLRWRNALLQFAHLGCEVGLITDRAGHAAQQRGYFRTCLRETKDIVDEEQRVGAFGVAEIFGNGESGQSHAETRTWRLRHLSIDQSGLGFGWLAWLDYARLGHFEPEIVAFTGTLADTGKHGESTVILGDVIDQLHYDDGLADASAAEQSDLAALQKRLDQVDDLHAGFEHFSSRGLLVECRSETVNRHSLLVLDRAQLIDRLADHVHDATKRAPSHRHGDRAALVDRFHAAHHTFSGFHSDAAHAAFAEVLLHFKNDLDGAGDIEAVADDLQGLIDRRQVAFGELHIDRRSCDLNDVSYVLWHISFELRAVSGESNHHSALSIQLFNLISAISVCHCGSKLIAQDSQLSSHSGRAADDLDDLFRDLCLTGTIHNQGQRIAHVSCVVGSRIHRVHTSRMFGGYRLQQRPENLDAYVLRQQRTEQFFRRLLVNVIDLRGAELSPGFLRAVSPAHAYARTHRGFLGFFLLFFRRLFSQSNRLFTDLLDRQDLFNDKPLCDH